MPKLSLKKEKQNWLDEVAPHIKIINWGGKASALSEFLDTKRNITFSSRFNDLARAVKSNKKIGPKWTEEEVQDWLEQNCPHVQILDWCGFATKKSKFLNKKTNKEFVLTFNQIRKNPKANFGLTKQEQIKTCQDKMLSSYGESNPGKIEKFKEKIRQTNLEKYGVENPQQNKQIRQKTKEANLERWGAENVSLSKQIQRKRENTFLKKYGETSPLKNKKIQEKIRQTVKQKWGVEYLHQNDEIKQKAWDTRAERGQITVVDGKSLLQWSKDPANAGHTTIYKAYRAGVAPWETSPKEYLTEAKIKKLLIEDALLVEGQDFFHNKKLPQLKGVFKGHKKPDFLIIESNLIIEVDGDLIHGNPKFWTGEDIVGHPKDPILAKHKWKIDEARTKLYESHRYNVLRFWEDDIVNNWDWVADQILNHLQASP